MVPSGEFGGPIAPFQTPVIEWVILAKGAFP
jgi:hypothetical protein